MFNKLFKSFIAVAMVLGSALGFVACNETDDPTTAEPKVELSASTLNFSKFEESQSVDIKSNSEWTVEVEESADWVTVTPMSGSKNGKITIAVSENSTGKVRTATVKVYAMHKTYGKYGNEKLTIQQSGTENATIDEVLLYGDDFDGAEATKTYGSGSSWPYIDQFPEFANPKGDAGAGVTYTGSGVSVRANSQSNSSYSDYAGSGVNNIFFGGGAYFQVNDIAPLEGVNFKVTFGTEKYTQDGDSTFKNEEFIMSISKDGEKWAPVEYTFAGTEPGRWNVATADFTLNAAVEKLYIKFEAKVASVYRLDDLKFYVGNGGQVIDLDNIQEPEKPEPPKTDALYYENFDGKAAVKDGNYWPYVTDFPEMKNAAGPAAANVSYDGHNTTVRNNSNSDGTYSDYAGSGVNNIFFGKVENHFTIKGLALESTQKNLVLTFGTEKYSQSLGSKFTPSEFIVSLSADGEKWSAIEYTFAGTAEGRWNVATANFTLAEVPAELYIKFSATAESAYRLDDVTLDEGEGGQLIDLATGVAPEPAPTPGDAIKVTVAEFLDAAEDSTYYELTGVITSVTNTTYGNFYLKDDTAEVLIYGLSSPEGEPKYWAESGAKVGDTITVRTVRTSYNGTPQGKDAIFVSLVPGEGGGEEPTPEPAEGAYASDVAFVCSTDDSTNAVYSLGATTINGNAATGFKLGKSKQAGKFTSGVVSVSGNKYLNFYAQGWKGGDVTLYFRVDGGVTMSQKLASHDGVTGNPPYTALSFAETDHYSVLLEGLTETSTIEFSTDANFELTTADSTMASARAIVCGVKLTDEPLGNEGGNDTPAPEPSVVKATVADFLAAAEDSTIYELTGEITSVTNTTYGNFYLNDGTGEVLIYGLCSPSGEQQYWAESGAKVGDTITVQTVRTSYNGTPQGKNAIFVSLVPGEGGSQTPDPTPGDAMTIADVLAKGNGATIGGVIEGVVISNMDLNNLTSKKGLYVQDETGALQFYLAANHEFAFGTKVKIDLTTATLGSYNGAVQVSGVGLDKITVVSTDNVVEAKTVSMADFLANKYEGQYIALEGVQVAASDLSKTWVMDGAHTSIAMEDASGNSFVVFSSKYASYGAETVAQGAGTLKGISSINNGTIQIIFAQTTDFAGLTGERFGDAGGEEPEQPGDEPSVPEGYAGRDDFNTLDWSSSYIARESTAGWVGENCAVQAGGANDANPVFNSLLGADTNARAWVINGKTAAVGKITSPVITTGCGTLTFNYGMAFTEKNGYNFTVDIMQNGEVVKTFNVVNADNTKFAKHTFTEEVNVAGEFQIVITNNCPSANADSNKDRVSIWDVMWTAQN